MENTGQNRIHNASFNFEYGTVASAERSADLIETIFNSQILPELDKAISNHIPEGLVVELSKLEINIGNINEKELESHLAGRIRNALEDALQNRTRIGKYQFSGETDSAEQKLDNFLLESIGSYFRKGYFPLGMGNSVPMDELVTNAIGHHQHEFIEIIKKYRRYDGILQRIASSLSAETFDLILLALEPSSGKWMIDFRQILIDTRKEANQNQISGNEFIRTMNYLSLNYLLNDTGSGFSKDKFSDSVLSQLLRFFKTDVQWFVQAFKKHQNPVAGFILESLSKLNERQAQLLPEIAGQNLTIDSLLEILNAGSIQEKTVTPELLKFAIVQAIRNTGKRKQLIEKLSRSGIRLILALFSGNDADALFELISAFCNNVVVQTENATSLNEIAIHTASYLSQSAIRILSPEEFVLFLIYSAGLDDLKTVHSASFRSFVQTQKNIELKRIHALMDDEALYPEISDIQKLLLKKEITSSSGNQIQSVVFTAEEYFIITKRKIIAYYLYSGMLPDAYSDLRLTDVKTIFEELIHLKDDFLAKQFHQAEHPDRLIKRLDTLIGDMPLEKLEAYLIHYFKREFDLLVRLIAHARQHFPTGLSPRNDWPFSYEIFISSLAKSKGGSLPEVFLLSAMEGLNNEWTKNSDKFIGFLFSNSEIPEIGALLNKESLGLELAKMLDRDFKQLITKLHLSKFEIKSSEEEVKRLINSISFYFQVDQKSFLDYLQENHTDLTQVFTLFKSHFDQNLWKSMEKFVISRPEHKPELEKFQLQSDILLRKMKEGGYDLVRIFKSTDSWNSGNLKLFLDLIRNNDALVEKIISNTKEIQFPPNLNFGSPTTINYLNRFLSHPPQVKSTKINDDFWKSLVWSFVFQTISEAAEFSSIALERSFLYHILLKLKTIREEELFYPILEQLKLSKSKEFLELAGSWPDTKMLVANASGSEEEDQNPEKSTDYYLSVLRFYASNGFFPWWAGHVSFPEMMSGLFNSSRLHPDIFENSFLRIEKEEPILELLIPKIPKFVRNEFDQLFAAHTELKSIWKKLLLKNTKSVRLKSGDKEDSEDQSILLMEFYNSDDEKVSRKWLNGFPEIASQIQEYLSLSPYFYFRNLNPAQWSKAVYQFSLNYYGQAPTQLNGHFPDDFLIYLKQNYPNINWSENLAAVYQLVHSPNATVKAVFPEALIPFVNIETKNEAMTDNENILISDNEGDEVKIYNSGLILFWPFLTRLYEILSLIENGEFNDVESKNRAVYILQYLVYNEIDFPEHQLVLNKLLAGMLPEEHLVPLTSLTDEEMDSAKSLLNGLINNWDKMKNTSPEGLQETFLQREGILKFQTDKITLTVEQKGFDILLQSIPWNISLIKLSWMEKPIYVEWI